MGRKAGFRSVCRSGTGYWRRPHWSNFDHTILPWQGCSQTEGVEDRLSHIFSLLSWGRDKTANTAYVSSPQPVRRWEIIKLFFCCSPVEHMSLTHNLAKDAATAKPVYNGHLLRMDKLAAIQRCLDYAGHFTLSFGASRVVMMARLHRNTTIQVLPCNLHYLWHWHVKK